MQVKLSKLISSKSALADLVSRPIPVKAAYWLLKVSKQVAVEIELFEAARSKIIFSLGTESTEVKGSFTVAPEKKEEFISQLEPILATDIEILPDTKTPFKGFTLSELGNATISAANLSQLEWLIKE